MARLRLILWLDLYLCLCIFPLSAAANPASADDWACLCRAASFMFSAGRFAEAASIYQRAYFTGQNARLGTEELIDTLLNKSECLTLAGDFQASQETLKRAFTLITQSKLSDFPITARFFRRQVVFFQKQGRFADAVQSQSKLVELSAIIFGNQSSAIIAELDKLAELQCLANQNEEALLTGRKLLEALKICQVAPESPFWARAHERMGRSLKELKRF